MPLRRYHPAPPDYQIVEERQDAASPPQFVLFRHGTEVTRTPSAQLAWSFAESELAAMPRPYRPRR